MTATPRAVTNHSPTPAAAAKENARARFAMAVFFHQLDDSPENERKALKWLTEAASAGNRVAQFNLAIYYLRGEGASRDPAKARKWVARSAAQGFEPAIGLQQLPIFGDGGQRGNRAQGTAPTSGKIAETK
ncbi:tetratricopeptide repeat protein [Bradyrhizobium arachidis]|uniref:tetratricopeptide repeat protein n=1 Tax=Bradyrhizobium arachidis TaxID=858423 RepID=UPI0021618A01|nr:hypothetical protein [Bradyrhizobium arachidis]UVO30181.1 SEL1-like repeat protein [Bradyrhizobium arachidis]